MRWKLTCLFVCLCVCLCSTKRDYDNALLACEDQLRNAKDIDDGRETELSVMGTHRQIHNCT